MVLKKIGLSIYKTIKKVLDGYGIASIYPINLINSYLIKHLRQNFAVVQGHGMFLDANDSQGLSIDENFEKFEIYFAKQNIKQGDVVLDLGASIGYYTLIFARLVGDTGKVYAFEPNPENFALLKKNVEYNNYKNVVLINKAVSDKNGKAQFFLSEMNVDSGSLEVMYDKIVGNKESYHIEVETIKLDDYFKYYKGGINFIKMDIEGSEYSALLGMKGLLKRSRGIKMIVEYQPWTLAEARVTPQMFLELLRELGFDYRDAQNGNLDAYAIEKKNWTNLLCVKDNAKQQSGELTGVGLAKGK